MKIIDTFIFYNEIELLNYRLSILYEYVDYFIIVESKHTFTGNIKPLFYLENIDIFKKFSNKVIHIISEMPFSQPNIDYNLGHQYINEHYQRENIKKGINDLTHILHDEDIIIFSDIDEIPNPSILKNILNKTLEIKLDEFYRLACDMYYYNLNLRIGEGSNWHGIKIIPYFYYKNMSLTFQEVRQLEHRQYVPIIKNGGWHLSYFGDDKFIYNKLLNFENMEEQHKDALNSLKNGELIEKIKNGINLLNNTSLVYIPIEENTNLPYKYDVYLTKFYTQ